MGVTFWIGDGQTGGKGEGGTGKHWGWDSAPGLQNLAKLNTRLIKMPLSHSGAIQTSLGICYRHWWL